MNLNCVFDLRLCCSGPVWGSYIIILDTPPGDLIEVSSSSYNLSIFSLKAGSHNDGGVGAALRESSSVIIRDLWPEIDSLGEAEHEGTSAATTRGCPEVLAPNPSPGTGGREEK
jgi:hypothetical protein